MLDADGDGELSDEEIDGAAEALKKLDADGDGKLSREELAPECPKPPPGRPHRGPGERQPQPPQEGDE